MVEQPVHPLRFRANLYVERLAGLARVRTARPDPRHRRRQAEGGEADYVRCAAINVDPETAARDLSIPHALMRRLGHADCGIYAEVIAGGYIAAGDTVTVST